MSGSQQNEIVVGGSPDTAREFASAFIKCHGGKRRLLSVVPEKQRSKIIITPPPGMENQTLLSFLDSFLLSEMPINRNFEIFPW
ncbi:MAG TPA: hypothetical protein VMD74_02065 [Candidatus Methylomirabilis sp.]|nr:hypothetical protein [Candidatus Methylomirabilis sp.]